MASSASKTNTKMKTKYKSTKSESADTRPCNICHGTGRVPKKKKK